MLYHHSSITLSIKSMGYSPLSITRGREFEFEISFKIQCIIKALTGTTYVVKVLALGELMFVFSCNL